MKTADHPIRILRIINRMNVGGPSYNVAYLSKYLPNQYTTKVVSGMIEKDEASSTYIFDELGISYTFIHSMYRKISLLNDLKAFLTIRRIINEYKPHIVHTHAAKAGALGRLATIFSYHKSQLVLHTYHGNIFDGYFSPIKSRIFIFIEQFLAKYTHAIVSISKTQKSDLVNKYAIAPDSKISIIPLGFDLTKFLNITMEDRYKIRQEFCIAEDRILVVITGRLTAIKNHIFLLDVLADCKMRLGIKMTTLIVGDGELKEQLFQYCTRLGLSYAEKKSINGTEDVIFASWRKDIPAINAASDICVLTSLNEGTPVSIIEAMASAKPILATRVGGIEDFVEDGISGMLSSLDVKEFSSKFDSLLSDSSLRFKMGQVARKSVEHKFSHSRLVSDMDSLYSSLLKEKYV